MPGENPYQYGQQNQYGPSTWNGAPQPPSFYPPPPGYPGAPTPPSQQQNYQPKQSAFTDIPVGDYIRDGVAAVLLFLSFFLPWTTGFGIAQGGSGGIIALVVLLTLLSLASLGLPYFARLGMLGQNWQVSQVRVLRLAVNGPFIAMVVVFLFYDVIRGMFRFSETSTVFTGDGIGSAAWFGLAGALLAAQPRAAELKLDSRAGPRWLGWIKPLTVVATGLAAVSGLLALIFILVTAGRYDYADGAQTLESLIVSLASGAVPVAVLGVVAFGVARRFDSWRLTIAGLSVALLVGGFFLSFDDLASVELFHTVTINPYYAITLLVAAGTIAFLPFGFPSDSDATHAGYVWLDAARNGVRIIAVWSFGVAISQLVMAATGFGLVSVGESIALAVFSLLIGILAVVGTKALALRYSTADPRPSREVVIGICLGLLVLMIGRLVTQSIMYDYGYPSVWTIDLAATASPIFIALAVALAPAVRDLYRGVPLFASVTAGPSPVTAFGQQVPQQHYAQPVQQTAGPAAAASDPRTAAATLFEIATNSPELRPAVAANPSTYDDLVAWLGKLGDPAVDAALARRAAGQFGLPAETVAPVQESRSESTGGIAPESVARPNLSKASAGDTHTQQAATNAPVNSRELVAADPSTPAATLFELATNSPELRPAIAANPSTYDDLLTWLGKLGDPEVDAALARRTNGDPGSTTQSPRERAAADPATPAATLFEIASNSPDLRALVASNPSTYPDLLSWLSKLGDPSVDAALARRSSGKSGPDESMSAGENAAGSESAEPETSETSEIAATSGVPQTVAPTEVIDADEDARAIADPTCSAAILFRVAEHRPELRATVAAHPNAYPGLLEWLAGLGDSAVNDALAARR